MNYSVLADQRKFLLKGAKYVHDEWMMLNKENVKNKHKELLLEGIHVLYKRKFNEFNVKVVRYVAQRKAIGGKKLSLFNAPN